MSNPVSFCSYSVYLVLNVIDNENFTYELFGENTFNITNVKKDTYEIDIIFKDFSN